MKRLVSIFLVLALVLAVSDMSAQTVDLKKIGVSLNMKTVTPKTWEYSTGLKVVGKGTRVYLTADTAGSGATPVTSFTWTFDGRPANSAATFEKGGAGIDESFKADSTGFYYVAVSVNGGAATSRDTVYASLYKGVDRYNMFAGCGCHNNPTDTKVYPRFTEWQGSNHATIYYRALTGQLEVVEETGQGLYGKNCPVCHTTGWDSTAVNGNYRNLARALPNPYPASWDSIWYVGLPLTADGRDVMITTGDTTTVWAQMPTAIRPVANIGCENCHGPLGQHASVFDMSKQYVAKSLEPDVCNVCHDGSSRHSIGSYFRGAKHANMVEENGSGCAPCHTGGSFVAWTKGNATYQPKTLPFPSGLYDAATMDNTDATCAVCHDPHSMELRTTKLDSLQNGYVPPTGTGGAGALCMNCHRARSNQNTYVKPASAPYYGFKSRFYPHHSNQADMFLGRNGYIFADAKLEGITTHVGLENGCVTCHMGMRNGLPNHTFSMDPADPNYSLLGGSRNYNPVTACIGCHGEMSSYDDIKAMYDYDKDGAIEGVMSEVTGLLSTLEAQLPHRNGVVIGRGSVNASDSAAVNGRLDLVEGIFTYHSVVEDRSNGMHNPKYTISVLQKALGLYPLAVERTEMGVPETFALTQNYPNPFNPTTNINFSLPQSSSVRIDVYDILGNHVSTILNETMGAGKFRVTWDGSDRNGSKVSSGMYIYRLQAGNLFTATKKMLMVK